MDDWEKLYPHPPFRRVAFAAVVLPDGERLPREVVVFDAEGVPRTHFPLEGEPPFTEWRGVTYVWGTRP